VTVSARNRNGRDKRREVRRDGGSGSDAIVRQDQPDPVEDAGVSQGHRPIGKNARCRDYIAGRLNSSIDYAKFAAAAGADILLDGEPLDVFKTVNRLDETTLRHRDLELRRDVFAHMVGAPPNKSLTAG